MSHRGGVISSTSNFSTSSNFGFKRRAQSGNRFTVSGCPMRLPLEKDLSRPVNWSSVVEVKQCFVQCSHLTVGLWCDPFYPVRLVAWLHSNLLGACLSYLHHSQLRSCEKALYDNINLSIDSCKYLYS